MSTTRWAMLGTATLICETAPRHRRGLGVDQPCGVQHVQAGLVDRDSRVGDPLAVAAEVGQRPAKCDPLGGAAAGELQRELGEADQAHAVVHPPRAEARLGDRERLAGPADDRAGGEAHVGEGDLAVPAGGVVEAHRGEHPLDLHPRGVERDEHHRMLVVAVGGGVGEPHEDRHLAVGMSDAGAPPLAPVEHHFFAVERRRGLHVGRIGGGDVGLGHAEGRANLPA